MASVHQRAFALQGGADATSTALWPLSLEGLLLLATVGLLKPTGHVGRRAHGTMWRAFVLGIPCVVADGGFMADFVGHPAQAARRSPTENAQAPKEHADGGVHRLSPRLPGVTGKGRDLRAVRRSRTEGSPSQPGRAERRRVRATMMPGL
ncbi:DUF2637 domain-containing protein [Streptomyces sp. S1A1-7]|nr:DUF2637 domain-containing protein [Streptomyces sp. S1A1-7]